MTRKLEVDVAMADVTVEVVTVEGPRGRTEAEVFAPALPGEGRPAVVIGAEATGLNDFGRDVARRLVGLGHVVVIPDYYRGDGPADPNSYEDLDGLRRAIGALDFNAAVSDQLAGIDHARGRSDVDPDRVSTWGYCTGGTLSWTAAALDRRLHRSVVYYPSQPVFEAHDARHPVSPLDLIRTQSVPTLFLVGDEDDVLDAERRATLQERMDESLGRHQLVVYPGAKHAFAGWMPGRHRADDAEDAWQRAVAWLTEPLSPK
jgi:carboxymethylenebutenolidase